MLLKMISMYYYILNEDKTVKPITDVMEWARWYESHEERFIKRTELPIGVLVSTVFLGIDHGYLGELLLFETMIFGGEHDGYMKRYATYEDALKGHDEAIELVYSVNNL